MIKNQQEKQQSLIKHNLIQKQKQQKTNININFITNPIVTSHSIMKIPPLINQIKVIQPIIITPIQQIHNNNSNNNNNSNSSHEKKETMKIKVNFKYQSSPSLKQQNLLFVNQNKTIRPRLLGSKSSNKSSAQNIMQLKDKDNRLSNINIGYAQTPVKKIYNSSSHQNSGEVNIQPFKLPYEEDRIIISHHQKNNNNNINKEQHYQYQILSQNNSNQRQKRIFLDCRSQNQRQKKFQKYKKNSLFSIQTTLKRRNRIFTQTHDKNNQNIGNIRMNSRAKNENKFNKINNKMNNVNNNNERMQKSHIIFDYKKLFYDPQNDQENIKKQKQRNQQSSINFNTINFDNQNYGNKNNNINKNNRNLGINKNNNQSNFFQMNKNFNNLLLKQSIISGAETIVDKLDHYQHNQNVNNKNDKCQNNLNLNNYYQIDKLSNPINKKLLKNCNSQQLKIPQTHQMNRQQRKDKMNHININNANNNNIMKNFNNNFNNNNNKNTSNNSNKTQFISKQYHNHQHQHQPLHLHENQHQHYIQFQHQNQLYQPFHRNRIQSDVIHIQLNPQRIKQQRIEKSYSVHKIPSSKIKISSPNKSFKSKQSNQIIRGTANSIIITDNVMSIHGNYAEKKYKQNDSKMVKNHYRMSKNQNGQHQNLHTFNSAIINVNEYQNNIKNNLSYDPNTNNKTNLNNNNIALSNNQKNQYYRSSFENFPQNNYLHEAKNQNGKGLFKIFHTSNGIHNQQHNHTLKYLNSHQNINKNRESNITNKQSHIISAYLSPITTKQNISQSVITRFYDQNQMQTPRLDSGKKNQSNYQIIDALSSELRREKQIRKEEERRKKSFFQEEQEENLLVYSVPIQNKEKKNQVKLMNGSENMTEGKRKQNLKDSIKKFIQKKKKKMIEKNQAVKVFMKNKKQNMIAAFILILGLIVLSLQIIE